MRKRNGFTLTEILVVIAMIAVVGTIIIVNTIAINNRSKDNEFNRMVENVKNATKTYVSLYPDDFSDLYSSKAFTYVSLKKVVKAGLLDEETINPYTKNPINLEDEYEGYVKVYVDGDSYEMVYTYPLTADDYNTQYWLQTTSITSNETEENGFDVVYAYEGIQPNSKKATTNFAFSNEQGNLIQPSMTPELNAKYTSVLAMYKDMFNLSYTVPPSFDQCSEANEKCKKVWEDNHPDGATIQDYYIPQKTGTYEIKYNWSYTNSQGKTITRSDNRTVRIISDTEREKQKVSTSAKTTKGTSVTTNENGETFRLENYTFDGTSVVPGYALLAPALNGKRQPFTIYIQGVDNGEQLASTRLFDLINSSDTSGFRISYYPGSKFELAGFYPGGGSSGTKDLPYGRGKRYRIVLYNDTSNRTEEGKIYVRYSKDIDSTKFNDNKGNTTALEVDSSIFITTQTSEQIFYIGGRSDGTAPTIGKIEKFVVFNKADPSLIFKDL